MHGGAPSSGGADSVPRKRTSSCRWFHVHFRVACDTQWGENLVLIGENDVLGEFEPKSGLWMGCKEEKSLLEDASPPPPSSSSAEASAPASGHDLVWKARISIPAEEACSCSSHYTVGPYRYVVVNHCLERLRGEPSWVRRTFDIPLSLKDGSVVCVCDTWQDPSGEPCVLRSAIFTSVVFRDALRGLRARWTAAGSRPAKVEAAAAGEVKNLVSFRVRNWQLNKGQSVFLLGGSRELGQWEESKALEMTLELGARDDPYGTWRVDVRMPVDQIGGSYKYLVKGEDGKGLLERGKCRRLAGGEMKQNADSGKLFTVHDDGHFRHDQHWKGAGIAVPVFSLRSKASVGCGEFSDLRHLIDFCSASQMSIIQLLPVNDTSVNDNWMDSYPYSSLSAFALHPMYINLSQVAGSGSKAAAPGDSKLRGIGNEIQACREALDLPSMDYEGTVKAKQEICKKLFFLQKDDCYADPSFVEFLDANAFWLAPYATFCALKKVFGHSDHSSWGSMKNASYALVKRMVTSVQDASRDLDPESDFGNLSRDLLELFNPKVGNKAELDFLVPFRELIAYSCFLQFHLSRQFLSVVGYAEERGIALKGDLPIGVDKNSVECWVKRRCFRMEVCAGAPPDYYSMEGQNWGFPTYNWDEMRNDSFSWWKQRLSHMAKYFHAYRIDHILGFFRIWEVPSSNDEEAINDNTLLPGLLGCFQPANAISRSELDSKGIWDIDRLCKPYITAELVEEVFGTLSAPVVDFFLFKRHHYYEFKESFRESNVTFWMDNAKWGENFLAFLSSDAQANAVDMQTTVEKVQKGLRQILQNVVLLRDVNCEDKFHPRFGCLETHSFKALEPWVKEAISEFHEEYFFRRQNDLWKKNAADILPKLVEGSNGMLVCGEDLGLIPPCVPSVMKDLGILGLRIQRMPSDSSQEGEFGDLSNYPYQVVASPSCHDVPTVRAWWEEDYERAKRLWSRDLSKDGESDPPPPECKPFVVKAILDAHLASGACLMIAPLQDWLACCLSGKYNTVEASEERINDPTNSKHYWSFRSHVNVEDLCGDEELVSLVRDMVSSSGRGRIILKLAAPQGEARSTMALARTLSSLGRAALASPRLVRTASLGLDRAFSSTSSSASSTTSTSSSELGTQAEVRRHVEGLIKFRGGPITFAEYMKTSLGSPVGGYYGDKYVGKEGERAPVIGARGDFVTSPEISQLFGEMVGVWCLTVWQQLGSPDTLRLVELGPGKGTLMADLLRSTGSPSPIFHSFQSALYNGEKAGVSLVEISPAFREAQADKLSKFQKDGKGLNLEWHSALSDVPRDNTPTIYIAHEFLDALPVHMFVKKGAGWTELLVNLEDAQPVSLDPNAKPPEPQFVNMLSPGETPAMKMLLKPKLDTLGDATRAEIREVEVSASAIEHALDLGERLVSSKGGGAALFMDYGYEELPGRFTCRAIRDHKVLDDLLASGADITADVDFGALKWAVENYQWGEKAPKVFGAVTQAQFLLSCGIGHRVQALLESPGISEKQAQELVQGYTRLVGGSADEGMGEVYKAMALVSTPESTEPGVPVGF